MPYATLPRRQSKPPRWRRKQVLGMYVLIIAVAFLVGIGSVQYYQRDEIENPGATATQQNQQEAPPEPAFDKNQHSIDEPASPWVVVNKQRPLRPLNYAPSDLTTPSVPLKYAAGSMESQLRQEAATALQELFAAASADGISLLFVSGYRSYAHQQALFTRYASNMGQAAAELISARAGHSEHQTGWAADVGAANRQCEVETCFGTMAEGKWVAANAHRFGFVVRYPESYTETTGFSYEPWHLRYVGKPLAAELHKNNIATLENFFNLPPAPGY